MSLPALPQALVSLADACTELHRQFAHLRIRHEWFRADSELLKYIAGIQEQCTAAES